MLVDTLRIVDGNVHKVAAEALDKLGWKLSDQPDIIVWYWIAKEQWDKVTALGSPAVEPLIIVLEESVFESEAAAAALGELGDPCAIDALTAALNDDNDDVRKAAAKALEKIGINPE